MNDIYSVNCLLVSRNLGPLGYPADTERLKKPLSSQGALIGQHEATLVKGNVLRSCRHNTPSPMSPICSDSASIWASVLCSPRYALSSFLRAFYSSQFLFQCCLVFSYNPPRIPPTLQRSHSCTAFSHWPPFLLIKVSILISKPSPGRCKWFSTILSRRVRRSVASVP